MAKKKSQKSKNGAWFVRKRGSYLAKSPIAVLLMAVFLLSGLLVIGMALDDNRPLLSAGISMVLSLIGLGAIFNWIASHKS